MTFRAGQSGNPGGRPRAEPKVRDLARKHTTAAINGLAAILKDSESDLAKVSAANALLDRGWGKPTVHIEGDLGLNLGLDSEVASDIARIFGLAPAGVPADEPQSRRPVVPGKAHRGGKARARKA
jgi:hypothetical protein